MAELTDFSSFNPAEEKAFVPFEAMMRANEKRSFTIGFGIAGALFVVISLICMTGYTPCTRFCERPPSTCEGAAATDFKNNCPAACRALEKETGLSIEKEKKDDKTGVVKDDKIPVTGTEFVENLAACAFSGGGGYTCDGVTKYAESKGLWCAKK